MKEKLVARKLNICFFVLKNHAGFILITIGLSDYYAFRALERILNFVQINEAIQDIKDKRKRYWRKLKTTFNYKKYNVEEII